MRPSSLRSPMRCSMSSLVLLLAAFTTMLVSSRAKMQHRKAFADEESIATGTGSTATRTAVCISGHGRTFGGAGVYKSHVHHVLDPLHADAFLVLDLSPSHSTQPTIEGLNEALVYMGDRVRRGIVYHPDLQHSEGQLAANVSSRVNVKRSANDLIHPKVSGPGGKRPARYDVRRTACRTGFRECGRPCFHLYSQYGKIAQCLGLIEEEERAKGVRYTHVGFLRPDLYFFEPLQISGLQNLTNYAAVLDCKPANRKTPRYCAEPKVEGACEVPNDWTAWLPRSLAEAYLTMAFDMKGCIPDHELYCGCHVKAGGLASECIVNSLLRKRDVPIMAGYVGIPGTPMLLARKTNGDKVFSNVVLGDRSRIHGPGTQKFGEGIYNVAFSG